MSEMPSCTPSSPFVSLQQWHGTLLQHSLSLVDRILTSDLLFLSQSVGSSQPAVHLAVVYHSTHEHHVSRTRSVAWRRQWSGDSLRFLELDEVFDVRLWEQSL